MADQPKQDQQGNGQAMTIDHCGKGQGCKESRVYCWPALPIDAEQFYFIGAGEEGCPYKVSYGSLYTCSCPLRQEIYKRYKI